MSEGTVKSKYGFLPLSVMTFTNKGWFFEDKSLNIDLKRRGEGIKYLPELPYSKFSFGLSEAVIRYWSEPGDVVLDQYMGWGIRGMVATKLGRTYVGYDISPEMFKRGKNHIDYLQDKDARLYFGGDSEDSSPPQYRLILGDGTKLEEMNTTCVDLAFTCPPYWNIEKYEDVPRQLSSAPSYKSFLKMIEDGLVSAKRVLKPGGFLVYVVADFRAESELKNFHGDLIEMGKRVGLRYWDIAISVLLSPFAALQAAKCDKQKYTSKKHEYIVVFKKV